jgi:uncharacterized membrane protein YdjX (TVP38/TMEM64 family)
MSTQPQKQDLNPPAARPRFELKHAAALVLAVGITLGILAFSDQIKQLESLGYIGIFAVMLLTSATLILPAPGLLFVFTLGGTLNPLLVGLAAGAGTTLGEITGYMAGYSGSGVVENTETYHRIERLIKKYGLWVIFVLAAIPNPLFDIAGMIAGATGITWWEFLGSTFVGKTLKTIVVAYAGAFSIDWIYHLLK